MTTRIADNVHRYTLCLAFVLFVCWGQTQGAVNGQALAQRAEEKFVAATTVKGQEFQVMTSLVADTKMFVTRSLNKKLLHQVQEMSSKEIRVRKPAEAAALHLGILTLTYQNERAAAAALKLGHEKNGGYLVHTKILTRYKLLQRGNILLLLYSETFIDTQVDQFFKEIDQL